MNIRFPRSGQAAKIARLCLAEQGVNISHSAALELVARLHGYANWQAMDADKRFEDKPGLKPVASAEYDFQLPAGQAVRIGVENVRVHIKREAEGVAIDVHARELERMPGPLASAYVFYSDALPSVPCETGLFLSVDAKGTQWYYATLPLAPVTKAEQRPADAVGPFESAEQAVEAAYEALGMEFEVQWRRAELPASGIFTVCQDGGAYRRGADLQDALRFAKAMSDSGAGGCWTVIDAHHRVLGLYWLGPNPVN